MEVPKTADALLISLGILASSIFFSVEVQFREVTIKWAKPNLERKRKSLLTSGIRRFWRISWWLVISILTPFLLMSILRALVQQMSSLQNVAEYQELCTRDLAYTPMVRREEGRFSASAAIHLIVNMSPWR